MDKRAAQEETRALELVTKTWDECAMDSSVPTLNGLPNTSVFTLKATYQTEEWVYIAVDLLASEFSRLWPRVKERTVGANGEEEVKNVSDHPVQMLLENPNRYQSKTDFLYKISTELNVTGNALILNPGNAGLWTLPTELVNIQVESFSNKNPISYIWSPDAYNSSTELEKKRMIQIPEDRMLHIKRPNTSNMYWGLSPLIPGNRTVRLYTYAQEYLENFYKKGANPHVFLKLEKNLGNVAMQRLLAGFERAYTGRKNQRRAMLLPPGVTAESVLNKIADQELIETIKLNRENVLQIWRIPKHAVGLAESGSLGSEEHKQALQMLWEATLLPQAELIADALTRYFAKELGPDMYIEFDTDDVPALQESYDKLAERASKLLQAGWTVNEVRTKIWDLKSREEGDFMPVAKPAASPFPGPFQLQIPEAKPEEKASKVMDEALLKHWNMCKAAEVQGANALERTVLDLLENQITEAIKLFRASPKSLVQKDFNSTAFRIALETALKGMQQTYVERSSQDLESTVDTGVGIQLQFSAVAGANEDQIAAILARDAEGRALQLRERNISTFEGLSKTSTDQIMDVITQGLGERKTVDQIVSDLAGLATTKWPSRARTIVRTESLTALSIGQSSTMDAMAKEYPEMQGGWLTAQDNLVRDSHEVMDGERVKWGEPFSNGNRFPRDPKGTASENINCRCSIIPILPEDL